MQKLFRVVVMAVTTDRMVNAKISEILKRIQHLAQKLKNIGNKN